MEERGYTTVIQAWDFRPGSSFVLEMQKAASDTRQTIMVLSPAYLAAEYTQPEWAATFAEDPRGVARKLIPVRVAPCKPAGLLRSLIYIDLVGLSAEEAAAALLGGLGRAGEAGDEAGLSGELHGLAGEAARMAPQEIPFPGSGALLPRQLPSPPADFVGREAELAALRAAAGAGGPIAVFGLRGLGGVGKTALALKLAGELACRYPDGQIFLDLQGVSTGVDAAVPLSPEQAMAHTITPPSSCRRPTCQRAPPRTRRALPIGAPRPSHPAADGQRGGPRAGRAADPARGLCPPGDLARPLPPAGSGDAGSRRVAGDGRPRPAPGNATRIGNEAGEIAELSGRLPFALRLAGSAFADRPDLSPADYAQSLARADHRFGPVDTRLEVSLGLLGEESRRLWCRLAVFPGTFDLEAAAAVWERELDEANATMGELVTASLVEWEARRARLHDLARLFARGQLGGEETAVAERRHAAHCLEVLRRAKRALRGRRRRPPSRLAAV